MAIIKIKQLIGTSKQNFDDALKQVVSQICSQKKNVSGVKILSQTVDVQDAKITEYKVNVKVAYRWEKELHQ